MAIVRTAGNRKARVLAAVALAALAAWVPATLPGPSAAALAEVAQSASPQPPATQPQRPSVAPRTGGGAKPQSPQPPRAPAGRPQAKPPAPPTAVLGPPPVELHPEVIDIGTVAPNRRASGTVYIHNISDKWLEIKATRADCKCTTINLAHTLLAPGESVPLEAEYHSNSTMGPKRGSVKILFDGYDVIEVPVTVLVGLPVRAEPPYVDAQPDSKSGRPRISGEYTLQSVDQRPFRILAVNGGPVLYVDFDPAKDEIRNTYRLKWDFSAFNLATCRDAEGNRLPGWVVVETDHPECPVLDLEVRHPCTRRALQRTDTWYIDEKRVLLGGLSEGAPVEFEVVVKRMPTVVSDDMVKTVVTESTQFSAEMVAIEPTEDGVVCRIRIVPAAGHRGLVYGTVRLHSNNQSGVVTVIGSVR